MDAFTPVDSMLDTTARWRIADAIAAATTTEEVAAIQADCEHRYKPVNHECWICGFAKPADPEYLIDDIPYLS